MMDNSQKEVDVSIIMLTYNHEKYIAQAIESVLAQETSLRYELIIGDDASTDRTPEIVREYAERYPDIIRAVLREKNLGANRNNFELVPMQRGRYCASLEGDDFWIDPHKMQKQYDFLEVHSEYIGCCGKCLVVDENGTPDYTKNPGFVWNKKEYSIKDYLDRWKVPGQTGGIMVRNYCVDLNPEEYAFTYQLHPMVGDKTWMLSHLSRGKIYCSNEILSAYRYVNQKGKDNHFSKHYANPYRNHDMFLYSCRLEDWARDNLGVREEIGKQQKKTRFCRFTEECVRTPSIKRLSYLAEMVARSHAPAKYAWYVLKTLIEME